jgi:hypothetical protein
VSSARAVRDHRRCAIDIRRHEFRHRTEPIDRIELRQGDGDRDGFVTWESNVVVRPSPHCRRQNATWMRLAYYDALTQQEIAEAPSRSPSAPSSRASARAHARLRRPSRRVASRRKRARGQPAVR